jgi:hypothetical protein
MGWYLKKSFAFGPLRLHLSNSGIGAFPDSKETESVGEPTSAGELFKESFLSGFFEGLLRGR